MRWERENIILRKTILILVLLLISMMTLSGCVSYDHLSKHSITQGNDFTNYYVFKEGNNNKDSLIIFIGGSGYSSVLGLKEYGIWKTITLAYDLQNKLLSDFDILVPEKKNIKMGKKHENERRVLENYTLEQRVSTASLVIDEYLENNEYEEVVLLGFSEGGYILPRIYLNLKSRKKISGLAVLSAGGLSQYNSLKTLNEKDYSYPEGYKNELKRLEEVVEDIKQNPDTIDKRYLGLPYKRWSSFMFYRPLDDLLKIDIPIFMGQGEMDMMSAVDSARSVKEEFVKMNKENLTYIEYKDKGHGFNGEFETIIKDIEDWFRKEIR